MNFPAITVTNSTPLVLDLNKFSYTQQFKPMALLTIAVDTGGDPAYYGDTPPAAFTLGSFNAPTGQKKVSFVDALSGNRISGASAVMAGMVCTGAAGLAAGSFVQEVHADYYVLNTNLTSALATDNTTFTAPAITDTTGILIAAGAEKTFTPLPGNLYLYGSLSIVVGSGKTATVRIRYRYF